MSCFSSPRERISIREVDRSVVERLKNELNVPAGIATILTARKLSTFEECKAFFRPESSQFHDPFLFRDMECAVKRIQSALRQKEKIAIYGDYDVDGVTSTALMVRFLRLLGADCTYVLPNRLVDGYGITESGIRQIATGGITLLISVDCGITAVNEVALANCLGIDVIVTDHHEPKEMLPEALALIDPKVHNCLYPDKNLAGVGVALKLCQAITRYMNVDNELWMQFLDFVALGTAADIVPLIGENRVIARLGFDRLKNTSHPGLKALIEQQGLSGKKISTSEVVFQLAPCINAVGRLGDPCRGVDLLLTNDPAEADVNARLLREANLERRALDSSVAEEAYNWVTNNCKPDEDFALVLGKEHWHVGVIGIVASKLVEKFNRPAILFSIGADGLARGSGRSIPGLHLLNALNACSDVLEGFGGHAAAAGMTIRSENIPVFRKKFNEIVSTMIAPDDLVPVVVADTEVTMNEISPKFFRIINEMAPFGPGNMRPVLFCRNLKHRYPPRLVGQNHLKLSVTGQGVVMDAIGFNLGDRHNEILNAASLGLAFTLDENEWNGKCSLQMKVKGISL
ncbi:MAG: single-stranded-DNA-specific exonuclease RecJ [Fibrobacter sp.]|nr:single-stranded-DNA-specific exonuclease RecJ [Fibrobacter sp.]